MNFSFPSGRCEKFLSGWPVLWHSEYIMLLCFGCVFHRFPDYYVYTTYACDTIIYWMAILFFSSSLTRHRQPSRVFVVVWMLTLDVTSMPNRQNDRSSVVFTFVICSLVFFLFFCSGYRTLEQVSSSRHAFSYAYHSLCLHCYCESVWLWWSLLSPGSLLVRLWGICLSPVSCNCDCSRDTFCGVCDVSLLIDRDRWNLWNWLLRCEKLFCSIEHSRHIAYSRWLMQKVGRPFIIRLLRMSKKRRKKNQTERPPPSIYK